MKDNKDISIHLARKYARIFVLEHYLFLVAHSFPPATLSENCSLLGTDNVRGQISEHIFAPNDGYCLYIPNFQNCARCEKDVKDNKHDNLHLRLKYARIFVLGHYLFFKAHSLRSRKTVPFSEQTMSADKYPSVFSRHMETIVYVFLQITEKRVFGLILLFVQ